MLSTPPGLLSGATGPGYNDASRSTPKEVGACGYFAGFRPRVFFLGDSGSGGLLRLTYTSQESHTASSQSIFFSG